MLFHHDFQRIGGYVSYHFSLKQSIDYMAKKKPRLNVEAYFFLKCFSSLFLRSHEFIENLYCFHYQSGAKIGKSFNELA
ncbi:hypothetical protein HMPREF0665_00972 [Segatella oris C735]|uniref:Uncharacterized protein n=2 Tax=Segatella oris TaxID=28135 RepID=D7NBR5_9BACT|nr:hypothetical protein HMPREF0665_00972 [Segatella oris C735]